MENFRIFPQIFSFFVNILSKFCPIFNKYNTKQHITTRKFLLFAPSRFRTLGKNIFGRTKTGAEIPLRFVLVGNTFGQKKSAGSPAPFFSLFRFSVRLRNRPDRASFLARAAVDAGIRINHVLRITLRDRAHRARFGAGAAGDALLRNAVCHNS